MKESLLHILSKSVLCCLAVLLISPVSHALTTDAQGQYLTSAANESISKSFYSVSEYSDRIPELQETVSVNAKDAPIREVLENIVLKADLGIAYNAELLSLNQSITVDMQKVTVAEVLQKVLENTPYEAAISKTREIVLRDRPEPQRLLIQFQQEISGIVTDAETGDPLPGVNVMVPNTTVGTSTNENGEYSITAPDNADSLAFSFIGYQRQAVPINGRSTINVQLQSEVQSLGDDVVVTALGITRDERSIGYSSQEVGGDDLTYSQDQNVIGSLSGKIAGVQISGSSGASMGGTQTIKIRGVNSLSGEGQPLIVVDGTPISNQNFAGSGGADFGNLAQDVNPNDIESVNVLKGPAASALYGIRGQYGVVMITTKSGSGERDFSVDFNSSFEVQRAGNFMEYQNKYGAGYKLDFNTLSNGDPYVATNWDESWGPRMDGTMVREFFSFYPQDPRYGELTPFEPQPDNVKNFFETGFKSNQGITISGSGENSNYRLSFNDSRTEGVYPNTWHKRNNLGASVTTDVSEDWTFSTNLNYARNSGQRPPQGYGYGSQYFRQWFQRNVSMEELKNYKYDDGTIKHWNIGVPSAGETPSPAYWDNPYFLANENETRDDRNRVFGDFSVEYNVIPELTLNASVRGDVYVQSIEWKSAVGGTGTSGYTVGKYENREMNYDVSAQYKNNWDKISVDATLGGNIYDRNYSYLRQSTVGGLSTPGYYNIEASVDRPDNTSYKLEKQIYSAYGLLSLGYDETYFVDVSVRNDKSSTLPENNNSYWYPSVSGSFVFSELIDWDPLTFGKLRLSYAQAGSDLSPYQTTPVYSIGTVYDGTNTLSVPNNLNNPNIEPSFSHSYEGGFDLSFFGRLKLNFTYYEQQSKNQIIPLDISGTSGYNTATINAGLIENKGIEIALSGTPIESKDFMWDSKFNLGRNQNKVVELHPDIDVYTHNSSVYSGTASYLNSYEGEEYGALVGQAYQRDEETGKILLDDNNLPIWTDATHNFGSVLPEFTGGFQNTFNYKNFSLATMISFQSGGQFFSWSRMLAHKTGLAPATAAVNDRGNNVRDPVADGGGVKVEGISASTGQEVSTYVNARDYYRGVLGDDIYEDWVTDASYIKLSEVKLGYTFGNDLMNRLPIRSAEIAVYAKNPVMIWQAAPKGLDPSELSTGSQDITWTETGQLNTVRTFGLNLSLTF
ncbi:SusC/RagA family TonB-linked outer membrane protein [Aliifodinibius salipaludis]|nr:SusC/RagA family TonB-linked outer membrane protein [Aliifodinibius salipaludis]